VNRELIVRSSSDAVDFALLKDVTGLNAAFVNVGYEKDAFLHYHDLGPQLSSMLKFIKQVSTGKLKDYSLKNFPVEKDIDKHGVITDVIKANQSLLVQIVKEPISTKGPRISSELSIAGRYLVMVPFSDRVSVSQKISSGEEKDRLKRVELNRASSILRDVFNDSYTGIHVDNETLYNQIKDYVLEIAPAKESIVKLYNSSLPIFEKFGIERQIKTSFGRTAAMSKGAYLVIEHTEALHVVDVNSGNRSNKAKNQEDTALEVNLLAASEIARQLRLRDMGGIIVVDFIDMVKANPNANGQVEAPIVLIDKINADLEKLLKGPKANDGITLNIHPFIAAYITKGFPSIRFKWFLEHKKNIKVQPRDAYTYLEYRFKDKNGLNSFNHN